MAAPPGYNPRVDAPGWLADNYPQLKGNVYLDHAGAGVYSRQHVEQQARRLLSNLYGNPHSGHAAGQASNALVEEARALVLQYCGVTSATHHVVFTHSATAALALLGECWPAATAAAEAAAPQFTYVTHNHTSVVGLRDVLRSKGYTVVPVAPAEVEERVIQLATAANAASTTLSSPAFHPTTKNTTTTTPGLPHLFAYSAQCNLSGRRYPLRWATEMARSANPTPTLVLLDIASSAATTAPQLADVDFAPLSFYKLFGLATGAGALVISRRAAVLLNLSSTYFGGGTVTAYLAQDAGFRVDRPVLHERLERGTLPFLELAAVVDGFRQRLAKKDDDGNSWQAVAAHAMAVTQYAAGELASLPMVELLLADATAKGNSLSPLNQGPILAFLVRELSEPGRTYVSANEIATLAEAHGICLRAGCQCNAGACHDLLGVVAKDYAAAVERGYVCGGSTDLTADGRPLGVVRVSFGASSRLADVDALIAVLMAYFGPASGDAETAGEEEAIADAQEANATAAHRHQSRYLGPLRRQPLGHPPHRRLASLHLYPVKSCAAFSPPAWPVDPVGGHLVHDRAFAVVDASTGAALTQKQCAAMCFVQPEVDLEVGVLRLRDSRGEAIAGPLPPSIPLVGGSNNNHSSSSSTSATAEDAVASCNVCGQAVQALDCGDAVAAWLGLVLKRPCRLVRSDAASTAAMDEACRRGVSGRGGANDFQNEAPLLLCSRSSLRALHARNNAGRNGGDREVAASIDRFRPNLVVDGGWPWEEDVWRRLRLQTTGKNTASVTLALGKPCRRCQMVCIDQQTGQRTAEPLAALSKWRRRQGGTYFGVYAGVVDGDENCWLRVGDAVEVLEITEMVK